MGEKHAYRLIRDLFAHKEAIFGELKRASALSHTPSGGKLPDPSRSRAISTDESHRRANMEARNRAIASKSRNSSPAPHANGRTHRRDRSVDPPMTRFPIQTSPTSVEQRRGIKHTSLEVPSDYSPSATADRGNNAPSSNQNGAPAPQTIPEHSSTAAPSDSHSESSHAPSSRPTSIEDSNGVPYSSSFNERADAAGRSSRFPPRKAVGAGSLNRMSGGTNPRDSMGSEPGAAEKESRGVQLSDRPMDD